MPNRLKQLMQQLADAKAKGDTDKIDIIQQELFILSRPRPKKISEENSNDMTDYPIGEGKEYPGNPNMPIIRNKPSFTIEEIKDGGLIELNKGKDYIKDLI